MKKLEIKISNRVLCKALSDSVKETGVLFQRGVNHLTYRQTCELARIATDGLHEFDPFVDHFLEDLVEMWEHWDDTEPTEIEYGSGQYHYMKFID